MSFNNELAFESALINLLFEKGWEKNVLKNKTEKELLQNWADILFENNPYIAMGTDRFRGGALSKGALMGAPGIHAAIDDGLLDICLLYTSSTKLLCRD